MGLLFDSTDFFFVSGKSVEVKTISLFAFLLFNHQKHNTNCDLSRLSYTPRFKSGCQVRYPWKLSGR